MASELGVQLSTWMRRGHLMDSLQFPLDLAQPLHVCSASVIFGVSYADLRARLDRVPDPCQVTCCIHLPDLLQHFGCVLRACQL